jgi:hypothetical protein
MQPTPTIADVALSFARSIVAGEYETAHSMLSESMRRETSASDLRANYEQMVSYTTSPPDTIKIGQLFEPSDKDGVPGSLGWAFVDVDCVNSSDDCWLESIGVLVISESAGQVIARIEWGRP